MTGGGFVKIYGSILQSSVWFEDAPTRILWITMLTMADRRGIVVASLPGLAHAANVTREQCEAGLARLAAPDPDSKSKRSEGRRIRETKGGWQIINYTSYRELRTASQVKEAERKQQWRKSKSDNAPAAGHVPDVPSCHAQKSDADVDRDTTTTTPLPPAAVAAKRVRGLPPYDALFEEAWAQYPKRPNNSKAAAWRQWLARVKEGADPVIMLAGTVAYRQHCDRTQAEPRFIKQSQTFYGPDRHFETDYGPVTEPPIVDEFGVMTPYGIRVTMPPAPLRVA